MNHSVPLTTEEMQILNRYLSIKMRAVDLDQAEHGVFFDVIFRVGNQTFFITRDCDEQETANFIMLMFAKALARMMEKEKQA